MAKGDFVGRSIEKEVFIEASPERVFRALTEKGELERWFVTKAEVDLCPGGVISFYWARKAGIANTGKVLALEPPRRFSYSWEALEPTPTTILFELMGEDSGTRLHLVHSGIGEGEEWDRYYESRNGGWDVYLKSLINWLERGEEKDW